MRLKIYGKLVVSSVFFLFGVSNYSYAANEVQEECFNYLKTNMSEISSFELPYAEIESMTYSTLENNFSRYYKNTSSFGIELDEPLFEMRLYSFGEQTGYIHPPFSPFKTYSETEKWDTAAKEYIIAEEYITNQDGEKVFLGCSFMKIISDDLMNVTADNYLYDGEIISLLKTDESLDYKAWYNENVSYDYDGKEFVTWNRLFVYPKSTQNEYFNKYDIINSFPTNVSSNFDALKKPERVDSEQGEGPGLIRVYVADHTGKIVEFLGPDELSPVPQTGNNEIFSLFSFYQSIENTFPEFAKKLALRGEIHFDTVKEVIGTRDNANFAHIWNTVLNSNDLTKYAKGEKEGNVEEIFSEGEADFYKRRLEMIGNIESEINNVMENDTVMIEQTNGNNGNNEVNNNIEDSNINNENDKVNNESNDTVQSNMILPIIIVSGLLILLIVSVLLYKRNKK